LYLAEEGNVAKTEERGNALQGEENPGGETRYNDDILDRHSSENSTEYVFLNVHGAQESIHRNEFRQPM
jgi:hypothetical protein